MLPKCPGVERCGKKPGPYRRGPLDRTVHMDQEINHEQSVTVGKTAVSLKPILYLSVYSFISGPKNERIDDTVHKK